MGPKMKRGLREHLERLRRNAVRVDQLRRTYADVSDGSFYAAYMAGAPDGFEAAEASVRRILGPREREAPARTLAAIEAEEGGLCVETSRIDTATVGRYGSGSRVLTVNEPDGSSAIAPGPRQGLCIASRANGAESRDRSARRRRV